jgi:hypothetical protein
VSANYIAEVSFQDSDNVSKDRFTNTFHFVSAGTDESSDVASCAQRVADFYITSDTSAGPFNFVGQFLATNINRTATVTVYAEADPTPRPERLVATFQLPAAEGTQDLPPSAAVVVSYYSTRNQPRLRGRLYIGPCNMIAMAGSGPAMVVPNFLNVLQAAATRLVANTDGAISLGAILTISGQNYGSAFGGITSSETASGQVSWAQRSALGAGTYKQTKKVGNGGTKIVTYSLVTAGFIGNGWHSQRRREVESTSRLVWGDAPT